MTKEWTTQPDVVLFLPCVDSGEGRGRTQSWGGGGWLTGVLLWSCSQREWHGK